MGNNSFSVFLLNNNLVYPCINRRRNVIVVIDVVVYTWVDRGRFPTIELDWEATKLKSFVNAEVFELPDKLYKCFFVFFSVDSKLYEVVLDLYKSA